MKVYHGTTAWEATSLVSNSRNWLYVTDTPHRAQLYADSRATHFDVSRDIRRSPGSVLVELETDDPIRWSHRPEDHPTLDQCEATIRSWRIISVTVYARAYDLKHGMSNLGTRREPRYVRAYEHLQEVFGDLLTIVVVDDA